MSMCKRAHARTSMRTNLLKLERSPKHARLAAGDVERRQALRVARAELGPRRQQELATGGPAAQHHRTCEQPAPDNQKCINILARMEF